jgi:hypothetical protein
MISPRVAPGRRAPVSRVRSVTEIIMIATHAHAPDGEPYAGQCQHDEENLVSG